MRWNANKGEETCKNCKFSKQYGEVTLTCEIALPPFVTQSTKASLYLVTPDSGCSLFTKRKERAPSVNKTD